jgi:hypothetical protein
MNRLIFLQYKMKAASKTWLSSFLVVLLICAVLLSASDYVKALVGIGPTGGGIATGGSHAVRKPASNVAPGNQVAYYPLDGDAKDYAQTSQNNLTDNNTVTQASTKTNAAQFTNASSQYLSITDNAALSAGDIDFSVSAWVYLDSNGANRTIVHKGSNVSNGNYEYFLFYYSTTNRFRWAVSASGGAEATLDANSLGAPATGTWYYIVAWHDATANTISIQVNNGTVDSTSYSSGSQDSSQAFNIGRANGSGFYWDGRIDAVGFWKRTLSSTERAQLYNGGRGMTYQQVQAASLTTNLNGYWDLNETSGSRADSAGANTLTDNASVTSNPGVTGIATGSAAQFTRANTEYFSKTDNADLSAADVDLTVAGWFYLDSVSTTRYLIAKGSSTVSLSTIDYRIYFSSGGTVNWNVSNGTTSATVSTAAGSAIANQWYYVVAWHDAVNDQIGISLNNAAAITSAHTGGVNDTTGTFYVGVGPGADVNGLHDGRMDEVAVWKRVLTADERASLYNGGFGRMYRDLSAPLKGSLVSYWDMEEDSGTRSDAHYHGQNHTTATGSPTVTQGKFSNAYTFNGSTDYLSNSALTTSLSGDMSASLWVKSSSSTTSMRIFDLAQAATIGTQITMGSGVIGLDNSGGPTSSVSTGSGMNDGQWHHVVVTRSGTTYTLYVDNVSIGTSGGTAPTYTRVFIGVRSNALNFFNGSIDDVRVFNTALTTTQIAALYGGSIAPSCDQTCLGYWKMDEPSGVTTQDASGGTANNLTDNNTVTQATGIVGNAGQFTAANSEYLTVADNPSLSTGNIDFTVSGWVYFDTVVHGEVVVSKYNSTTNGEWFVRVNGTSLEFSVTNGVAGPTLGQVTRSGLTAGSWFFFVAWHDSVGDTVNLQLNNGTVGTTAFSAGSNDSTQPFQMSGIGPNSSFLDGRLDEVGFWKRTLTSGERTALYNAGSGVTYGSLSASDKVNLVSYWDMDEPAGTRVDRHAATGSIVASPTLNAGGVYNGAMTFNGTTQYVATNRTTGIANSNTYTVAAWFNTTSSSSSAIYHEGSSSSTTPFVGLRLNRIATGDVAGEMRDDAGTSISGSVVAYTGNYNDGQWHYAVFVRTASNSFSLYVDGILRNTSTGNAPTTTTVNRATIGAVRNTSTSTYYAGSIDDVRVYNRALQPYEIHDQYLAGR